MRKVPVLTHLGDRVKLQIKERVPGWLLSRVRPNAIRTVQGTTRARHGPGIPLFALVCAWFEHDIVYAAVRHAFEQGVDRVYLVDNASPDSTIEEAVAAGASHVMTFRTDTFDELMKYRLLNLLVERISVSSGLDRVWWLMMDADEFTNAPNDEHLPEFLARTDERCRVVGARVLDHYPTPGVSMPPRTNPLVAQPRCREKVDHRCALGHHKHPLFLWDRHRRPIVVDPGFHQLTCRGEALYEPSTSLVMHHFPFRNEVDTRHRLTLLMERGATEATQEGNSDLHMRARFESLEAVYRGDYTNVIDHMTGRAGIVVRDWRDVLELPKLDRDSETC